MKNWKIITIVSVAAMVGCIVSFISVCRCHDGRRRLRRLWRNDGRRLWHWIRNNSPPYTTRTTTQVHPQANTISQFTRSMFGGGMMGRLGNGHGFGGMMSGYGYTAPYAYTGTPLTIINTQ